MRDGTHRPILAVSALIISSQKTGIFDIPFSEQCSRVTCGVGETGNLGHLSLCVLRAT